MQVYGQTQEMKEGAWEGAWNRINEIRGDRRGCLKYPPARCWGFRCDSWSWNFSLMESGDCCLLLPFVVTFELFTYTLKLGTSWKNNWAQCAMSKNAHIFIRAARFLEAWIVVYECFGWAVLRLSLGVDSGQRLFDNHCISFCMRDYILFKWLFILGASRCPYMLLYVWFLIPSSPI